MGRKKNWTISALVVIPVMLLVSMRGTEPGRAAEPGGISTEDPTPVPDDPLEPPIPEEETNPGIDWARVTMPGPAQMTNHPILGSPMLVQEAPADLQPQSLPASEPPIATAPPTAPAPSDPSDPAPPSYEPAPVPLPNPGEGELQPSASANPAAGPQTYIVQHGDTLYSISLKFGISQYDLAAANYIIWWDYIYAGDEMIIPAAGGSSSAAPSAPAAQASSVAAPSSPVTAPSSPMEAPASSTGSSSPPGSPALTGPTTYIVQRGDSLGSISGRLGVDFGALVTANNITNPDYIWAGQALIIPAGGSAPTSHTSASPPETENLPQNEAPAQPPAPAVVSESEEPGPTVYIVQRGDSLVKIARQYTVDVMSLVTTNNIVNPNHIYPGQEIVIPTTSEISNQTGSGEPEETGEPAVNESPSGRFIWPVENYRIVKWFSYYHPGIDLVVDVGTPVIAAAAGEVEFAGWNQYGYGYAIIIHHGDGVRTLYAHNSELLVAEGDWVDQGQTISLSGSTGWSTWPHVHLELIFNEQVRYNPCDYFPDGCR